MSILSLVYEARWFIAVVVFICCILKTYKQYAKLSTFPGAFLCNFSEYPHSRAIFANRSHTWYHEISTKYGPIARIGPNDLLTTSPDLLTHISAARSPYTRAKWFYRATRFEPGRDNLASSIDDAFHTMRRKQMAPGYSGKENTSLEPSIDLHVQDLLALIRQKYISTPGNFRPMDLARKIQFFTLDVISDIGFGGAFGDLVNDEDTDDYISSAESGMSIQPLIAALGLTSIVQIRWIAALLMPTEKDAKGFGKMKATAIRLISPRFGPQKVQRRDMLDSFIRHGLNRQDDLVTEALLQILAGSDTTATALRCALLFLITTPTAYRSLQAEIDSVSAGLTTPIIKDAESRKLPYLQAVIKESVRMHPPVSDILPKRVPDGGDAVVIDGQLVHLPGGTNIGYSAFATQRNKDIYGADADVFRPERWLEASREEGKYKLERMKRTLELTWGWGKWRCLGRDIALVELNKVIFELLRHFDFALVDPERPWTKENFMGIFVVRDMWVNISERAFA